MAKSNPNEFDPDSAIIDADLLVKYRMVTRAVETLERADQAIGGYPRGNFMRLREESVRLGRSGAAQCEDEPRRPRSAVTPLQERCCGVPPRFPLR